MALAEKLKATGAVVIAFLGDGTLGEGVIYEAFNMASLWKAPILYVLENNRIAQTTPVELAVAGEVESRFNAFGIPSKTLDTSDVLEILPVAAELIHLVRTESRPCALVLNTHRFGPHSKGDDTRDPLVVSQLWLEHDPLRIHGERLERAERATIETAVDKEIQNAFEQALRDPFPVNLT